MNGLLSERDILGINRINNAVENDIYYTRVSFSIRDYFDIIRIVTEINVPQTMNIRLLAMVDTTQRRILNDIDINPNSVVLFDDNGKRLIMSANANFMFDFMAREDDLTHTIAISGTEVDPIPGNATDVQIIPVDPNERGGVSYIWKGRRDIRFGDVVGMLIFLVIPYGRRINENTLTYQQRYIKDLYGRYNRIIRRVGAFFPYILKYPIKHLKKIQIYDSFEKKHYADACLISTLKYYNIVKEKISEVRSIFLNNKNNQILTKDLSKISQIINKPIKIRYYDDKRELFNMLKTYTTNRVTTTEPLIINLYENHYFPDVSIKCCSFAFTHPELELWKKYKNWYRIKGIRKGKVHYDHSKYLPAFKLVQHLVENKKHLLTLMSFEQLKHIENADLMREVNILKYTLPKIEEEEKDNHVVQQRLPVREFKGLKKEKIEKSLLKFDNNININNFFTTREDGTVVMHPNLCTLDKKFHKLFINEDYLRSNTNDTRLELLKYIDSKPIIMSSVKKIWLKPKLSNLIQHENYICYKYKGSFQNELEITKRYIKIFVDIETSTHEKRILSNNTEKFDLHIPYLLSASYQPLNPKNKYIVKSFQGKNCIKNFLQTLTCNCILIIHNLGYDGRFIIPYLSSQNRTIIKGTKIYSHDGYYINHNKKLILHVGLKDSLQLLNMALKKIPGQFGLNVKKEAFPYNYYTLENWNKPNLSVEGSKEYFKNEDEYKQFLNNLKDLNLFISDDMDMDEDEEKKKYFDHKKYAIFYCEQDVNVLRQGYEKFRELMYSITQIDVDNVISLPSLADKYLLEYGCFKGVYHVKCHIREFMQGAVEGGRVMSANNKCHHVKNTQIQDYDAVSLYPSAMIETGGIPKGLPKEFQCTDKNLDNYIEEKELLEKTSWIGEVEILNIPKKYKFPISSVMKDGKRCFDDTPKKIKMSHFKYKDLITLQSANMKILKGYYYDEGRNTLLISAMKHLFEKKLFYSNNGKKAIKNCYKLIMNSSYGKTIQKPILSNKSIIHKNEIMKKIFTNLPNFKSALKIYGTNDWYMLEMMETEEKVYTLPIFGVEILDQSKHIMNKVMCLAEDLNINIYYTDTDSMHIDDSNSGIEKLLKAYKKKYNFDLDGNNLSQFNSDFEQKGYKVNYSEEFISLAKKCYIDKLNCTNLETNEKELKYHFRLKGIPESSIMDAVSNPKVVTKMSNLGTVIETKKIKPFQNVFELYEFLLNRKETDPPICFNLLAGRVSFEMSSNFEVLSREMFVRCPKFNCIGNTLKLFF